MEEGPQVTNVNDLYNTVFDMCINVNATNTKMIENLSDIFKEIIDCKEEIKRLQKLVRKNNENAFTDSLLPKMP